MITTCEGNYFSLVAVRVMAFRGVSQKYAILMDLDVLNHDSIEIDVLHIHSDRNLFLNDRRIE